MAGVYFTTWTRCRTRPEVCGVVAAHWSVMEHGDACCSVVAAVYCWRAERRLVDGVLFAALGGYVVARTTQLLRAILKTAGKRLR